METENNSTEASNASSRVQEHIIPVPVKIHTILFNLPLPEDETSCPTPRTGEDRWDDDHVKLPTSSSSTYLEIDENGERSQKLRWDLIREALTAAPITDSRKLEEAVKKYTPKKDQSFSALHQLFDDGFSEESSAVFFEEVLPKMIQLALRLPDLIKAPIPFLKKETNHSISMSQEQAVCLLVNAFFCTFPGRKGKTSYPEINFHRLFGCAGDHVVEKLKCLLHYFKMVCNDMPTGVITFQRRFIDKKDLPDLDKSTVKLSSIKVTVSESQKIEDVAGTLQVDFANRFLGGGVLGWGCVQEEIRFVINPEMIVGMLFCESMNITEAIVMTGCERFSRYEGYSRSFKWAGKFNDDTPRDSLRRRKTVVVAIDAMSTRSDLQFMEVAMAREVRKATVGYFHDPEYESVPMVVCSGNWGCGAFGGNKKLKALLQIIACCLCKRDLLYCTFGDDALVEQVTKITKMFKKLDVTVGNLWKYLKAFKASGCRVGELYSFIYNQHMKSLEEAKGSALEMRETLSDSKSVKDPPAKKQRISENSDEAEREILEGSVASLNGKLTSRENSPTETKEESKTSVFDSLASHEEPPTSIDDTVPSPPAAEVESMQTDDEITKTDDKLPEQPLEQIIERVDDNRKFKITDYFKLK